jgi:hypothetical protein
MCLTQTNEIFGQTLRFAREQTTDLSSCAMATHGTHSANAHFGFVFIHLLPKFGFGRKAILQAF